MLDKQSFGVVVRCPRGRVIPGGATSLTTVSVHCRGKMPSCPVALTATRSTHYKPIPVNDNFLDLVYHPREVTDFAEFVASFRPPYMEVDVVGLVVHVSQLATFDRSRSDELCICLQVLHCVFGCKHCVTVSCWEKESGVYSAGNRKRTHWTTGLMARV